MFDHDRSGLSLSLSLPVTTSLPEEDFDDDDKLLHACLRLFRQLNKTAKASVRAVFEEPAEADVGDALKEEDPCIVLHNGKIWFVAGGASYERTSCLDAVFVGVGFNAALGLGLKSPCWMFFQRGLMGLTLTNDVRVPCVETIIQNLFAG